MIYDEILPKIVGSIKAVALPCFLISSMNIHKKNEIVKNKPMTHDEVPGDNFPFVVINSHSNVH